MTNKFSLEQYLDGKHPLQPERTALPAEAELEAAEAEYDRIVSERTKAKTEQGDRPRLDRQYWAWGLSIAAVFILVFLLWPEKHETTTTAPEVLPAVAEIRTVERQPQAIPVPSLQPSLQKKHIRKTRGPVTPIQQEQPAEAASPQSEADELLASTAEADELLANTAEADEEIQTRIEAIDAITQAQAEQAYEAAVAAVLCSREPS